MKYVIRRVVSHRDGYPFYEYGGAVTKWDPTEVFHYKDKSFGEEMASVAGGELVPLDKAIKDENCMRRHFNLELV